MNRIDIKDQPILSFRRTVRITVDGIRYRLFRSIVTVAVVAVAIAFLMNILSESLIKKAIAENTGEGISQMQLGTAWKSRLDRPDTAEQVIRMTAAGGADNPGPYSQAVKMSGRKAEEMAELEDLARTATTYMDFFSALNVGRRRRLLGPASGPGAFDRLQSETHMDSFRTELAIISKSVRPPTESDQFDEFLSRWHELKTYTEAVRKGHQAASTRLKATLSEAGMSLEEAMRQGEFADQVRKSGFEFPDSTAAVVSSQLRALHRMALLERALNYERQVEGADGRSQKVKPVRRAVAKRLNREPRDITIDRLWDALSSGDGPQWYIGVLTNNEIDADGMAATDIELLAEQRARKASLARAQRLTAGVGEGFMGMGSHMSWLLLVSMTVCAVGICNAMLMTVTERFREIATLKCLGALDRFIMLMFVMEAVFLGVVGGLAGALLGAVIGLLRMIASFGYELVFSADMAPLGLAILLSTAVGVILAAGASILPSFKAARLAPMEAMRIE